MIDEVPSMAAELRRVGCEEWFHDLHHFSQPRFKKPKVTLNGFLNYTQKTGRFQPRGENNQTVRRVLHFVKLLETGHTPKIALNDSWIQLPLMKD